MGLILESMRGFVLTCLIVCFVAGLTSGCARREEITRITPEQLKSLLDRKEDFVFVDVRQPEELQVMGTLPGYVNIPLEVFASRYQEVPQHRRLVVACNRAQRAAKAAAILAQHGYSRIEVCALNEYRERGYPLIHPKVGEPSGVR